MNQIKVKKVKGGLTMFNKKGVSAIIATVLLILITIATVTIVWTVVVPMVQDNLGQAESFTDCIYAAEQFQILENENACYSLTGGNTITLNIPTKLGGKDFNFYGLSYATSFKTGMTGAPGVFEESFSGKITDSVKLPSLGGTKIINIQETFVNSGTEIIEDNAVYNTQTGHYSPLRDSIDVSLTVLTIRNDKESSCGDTTKTITLPVCSTA